MASTSSAGKVAVVSTASPTLPITVWTMPPADAKDDVHQLHAVAYRHFGGCKTDEVPDGKFRALKVSKAGGGLKNPHGEK